EVLAVGAVGQAADTAFVTLQGAEQLSGSEAPDEDVHPAGDGEDVAVGTEGDVDGGGPLFQAHDLGAGGVVPHFDGPVVRAGRQAGAVGREGDGEDRVVVSADELSSLARRDVPELDAVAVVLCLPRPDRPGGESAGGMEGDRRVGAGAVARIG